MFYLANPSPPGQTEKSFGEPRPGQCSGNPCNSATGNKYQLEQDYRSTDSILSFSRHYNSQLTKNLGLGFGWTSAFYRRLETSGSPVQIRQADGRGEPFYCASNACTGDADTALTLTQDDSGYTLTLRDKSTERYDLTGKLLSETSPSGQTITYGYDTNGRLATVTGPFGHTLTFGYNASGHVSTITDPSGQVIGYIYDADNNLTRVDYPDTTAKIYHYENTSFPHHLTGISYVNSAGVTTRFSTYAYDATGKAIRTEHAQTDNGSPQEKFTLAYDTDTQTTVTDPVNMNEVMTFATNLGVKNLASKVNQSDGKTVQQTFDANNNLTCRKDEENRVTLYSYNATNQKLSMTEGLSGTDCNTCLTNPANCNVGGVGRVTTYDYLSPTLDLPRFIRRPSVASGQTFETELVYGDAGHPNLPTQVIQRGFTPSNASVSRTVTLGYNASGQVNSINGPRTDVFDITTLEYYACTAGGACGQLKKATNALGHITTYDLYDANGRLKQMTDPNGLRTSYIYDARGRVKTITQAPISGPAAVTQYSYTAWGDVSQVIDPDGVALNYQYGAAHYLRFIVDAAGNYIYYTYDLKGNRRGDDTYDPSGNLTRSVSYAYDLRNHLSSINLAGNITQLMYDAVGNLRSETNPNTHTTAHTPDALNRLIQTVDALNSVTGYSYDINDHPTVVNAPNNLSTQYSYDDLGNRLQEVSPDRGTTSYNYDAGGNVLTVKDARNITTTYTYDALNRVTSKTSSDSNTPGYTYFYDSCSFKGKLCNVARNGAGHLIFSYDGLGRQTYQLDLTSGFLYSNYVFTRAGRLKHIDYPNGVAVDYTYNNMGRVSKVSATVNGTATILANNLQYYPFGPLSGLNFGNGKPYSVFYDAAYRPGVRFDGVYFESITGYDGNSNITQRYAPTWQSFGYDPLDRLTQASDSMNYGNLGYGYDSNGNRQSETRNGTTTPYYFYENSNRLYHAGDSDWRLMDAAGNTTWSNGLWAVSYDGYGRLLSASKAQSSYDYNAFNQRTKKTAGGVTTYFAYGSQGELLYEAGSGNKAYVYLEGVPLARIDNNSQVYYYHTDHLGAPQLMTNGSGTTVWKATYEPFGRATVTTQTIQNNVRLAGMYSDSETGLYYSWNNYYDPISGRWITPDKMSVAEHVARWRARMGVPGQPPLEINPYVRVLNNPLRWIDRTGFETTAMWGGDPFYELPDSPPYTLPAPVDPNGNYRPGFDAQIPGCDKFPDINSCVSQCCEEHDRCYERYGCNASSWKGNLLGENMACQQCNAAAKSCVIQNLNNTGKDCDNDCKQ